jgi:hypothetical protein
MGPICSRYAEQSVRMHYKGIYSGLRMDLKSPIDVVKGVSYGALLTLLGPLFPALLILSVVLIEYPTKFEGLKDRKPEYALILSIGLSYVAGLVLYACADEATRFLRKLVGFVIGRLRTDSRNPPWNRVPMWREPVWRKVAKEFLGPSLVPVTDEFPDPDKSFHTKVELAGFTKVQEQKRKEMEDLISALAEKLNSATNIDGQNEYSKEKRGALERLVQLEDAFQQENRRKLSEFESRDAVLQAADDEWCTWYAVLSTYLFPVPRGTEQEERTQLWLMSVLSTVGWTILILCYLRKFFAVPSTPGLPTWPMLCLSIVVIVIGTFAP